MIRAKCTQGNGRQLLILGVSKVNVGRLTSGEPISIKGNEFGLNIPIDIIIAYGETLEDLVKDFREAGIAIPEINTPPAKGFDA